jgi:hypothetical protein
MINTELAQDREIITNALTEINQIAQNYEKQDFDPNYKLTTDPTAIEKKGGAFSSEPMSIEFINKDFVVWRNKEWENRDQSDKIISSNAEKVKKQGLTKEFCEKYLVQYVTHFNLGKLVGVKTTGAVDRNFRPAVIKQNLINCNRAGLFEPGFLGTKKYENAINVLRTLPEDEGGIKNL